MIDYTRTGLPVEGFQSIKEQVPGIKTVTRKVSKSRLWEHFLWLAVTYDLPPLGGKREL